MSRPPPPDETQRELEQRALRNVRGLVDRMEDIERTDQRAQRRLLLWIVLGGLAVAIGLGLAVWHTASKNAGKPVVIDPAKLPPIRPGPPPKTQ
ncbi:MAG: hypothetical protein ACXWG1_16150 [Usitatibacter sp.]